MSDSAQAITNLIYVYAELIDAGDLDGVADLFAHGRICGVENGPPETVFEGRDRSSNGARWKATRVDLIFGANSQLRAIAEEYAAAGGEDLMLDAFVRGWVKVMENDRFDLD